MCLNLDKKSRAFDWGISGKEESMGKIAEKMSSGNSLEIAR